MIKNMSIKYNFVQNIPQFDQNEKFTPYLFKKELFEGKFLLDDKCKVLEYKIRNMQVRICKL